MFTSCTIQKRLYRPGFFVSVQKTNTAIHSEKAVEQSKPEHFSIGKQSHSVFLTTFRATFDTLFASVKLNHEPAIQKRAIPCWKNNIRLPKKIDASGPIRNHVPKAAFRLMLFSLLVLGGAYLVLLSLPQWVYVIFGLLIISFVFALVSLLTAVNAHRDKLNNSKGWLVMSTITWILCLLIIAGATLLFISLF